MAGITNDKLLETLNIIVSDVASIKETVKVVPDMYKDIYIGDGYPPLRKLCRDYYDEKKTKETAITETIKSKREFKTKLILQIIGAIIAFTFGQFALILAAINWIPGLLGLVK